MRWSKDFENDDGYFPGKDNLNGNQNLYSRSVYMVLFAHMLGESDLLVTDIASYYSKMALHLGVSSGKLLDWKDCRNHTMSRFVRANRFWRNYAP